MASGDVTVLRVTERIGNEFYDGWGYSNLISHFALFNQTNDYLSNNLLTIMCEVKAILSHFSKLKNNFGIFSAKVIYFAA